MKKTFLIGSAILILSLYEFNGTIAIAGNSEITSIREVEKETISGTNDKEIEYYVDYEPYFSEASDWRDGFDNVRMPIAEDENLWQSKPAYIERCELCAIPQEVIDNITTEELANLVIECPLGRQLMLSEGIDDGMTSFLRDFNGLRALLDREDCGTVIMNIYDSYHIPEEKAFDDSIISQDWSIEEFNEKAAEILQNDTYFAQIRADSQVRYIVNLCEWLLTQNKVTERLDEEDCESIITVICEKTSEKQESEYGESLDNYFLDKFEENLYGEMAVYGVVVSSAEIVQATGTSIEILYTPSGNRLEVEKYNNPTVMTREQSLAFLGDYANYIGLCVTLLGNGTSAYNCYAYAWFTMIPGYNTYARRYSLNNPQPLIDDERIRAIRFPISGCVMQFSGHAVYVEKINYSYASLGVQNDLLIQEKISAYGPLVKWPMSFSQKQTGLGGACTYYYYK